MVQLGLTTSNARRNRNNRARGKAAQVQWATLIHGRDLGILGEEDVDDGRRLWEVKHKVFPKWIRAAWEQVQGHAYHRHMQGYAVFKDTSTAGRAKWWVLLSAEQFIELQGLGLHEPNNE